jgi:OmcA/MtrC family decaheme c-type cytochrome
VLEPYAAIDSGASCIDCHKELEYHGMFRGFDACILCHGNAGAEDRPRYIAANAPDTTAVTTNFRALLHSIHHGSELAHAAKFEVVGASSAAYPDNFLAHSYAAHAFPAQPGGTMQCAKCHGTANQAWRDVRERAHPTEQDVPVLAWRAVCAACHDSIAAAAHYALGTDASGAESCAVCHGPGSFEAVDVVHRGR